MRSAVSAADAASSPPRSGEALGALFRSASLRALEPRLVHGFTGGTPRAQGEPLPAGTLAALRREPGVGATPLVLMRQPHGPRIATVDCGAALLGPPVQELPDVDGADASGAETPVLVVRTADCVPVLAVDLEGPRCAALHAGWRGAAAGILPALLEHWRAEGSDLERVRLVFGPHIRACCFQVRQDCVDAFAPADLEDALEPRDGSQYVALEQVLLNQARRAGIRDRHVETLPLCTDCHRSPQGEAVFASFRRANREGRPVGRNLSYIALHRP